MDRILEWNLAAANLTEADYRGWLGRSPGVQLTGHPPDLQATLRGRRGQWVQMHSARAPFAEAERWLAPARGRPGGVLVIIGLGLGYALDVLDTLDPAARVIALEPEPGLTAGLLRRRDISERLRLGRLLFAVAPDYAGLRAAWRWLDKPGDEPPLLVHPVLARERAAEVAAARKAWDEVRFGARANALAREANAGRYLCQTLANLPVIVREGDAAQLNSQFEDLPAVIVGAGPSLDHALGDLAWAQTRALIVAVDTAARPLLTAGVEPDLVVSLDPTDANARHLSGLPELAHTFLVAEPSLAPEAFGPFANRTLTFGLGLDPWPWLRQALGIQRGTLSVWGSVATAALDLVLRMGCPSVVLAGLDLAFTDGKPYCRGTIYEEDWARSVVNGQDLRQVFATWVGRWPEARGRDARGGESHTSSHLIAFANWMLARAAQEPRRYVNTGAGLLQGPGIEQAPVRSALADASTLDRQSVRRRIAACHQPALRPMPVSEEILRLVARARREPDDIEPLAQWLGFAGGRVTREDILARLEAAASALATNEPPPRPMPWALQLPSTEQVVTLTALFTGVASSDTLPVSPALLAADRQRDSEALAADACQAVTAALMCQAPVASGVDRRIEANILARRTVPAGLVFEWDASVLADVRRFEACIAEIWRRESLLDEGAASPYWSGPIEPVQVAACAAAAAAGEPDEASASWSPEQVDRSARFSLIWEYAVFRAARALRETPGSRRTLALLRACAPRMPSRPEPGGLFWDIHVQDSRLAPADAPSLEGSRAAVLPELMRALTGLAVPDDSRLDAVLRSLPVHSDDAAGVSISVRSVSGSRPGDAIHDPRRRLLTAAARWLEPLVMTDHGLSPALFGGTIDDDRALLAPVRGTSASVVDADGHVTARRAWPVPILGELPQPGAGSVAWHNTPGRLLWRTSDEGRVHVLDAPFRPNRLLALDTNVFLCAARGGGLWRWVPGTAPERVADAPPSLSIRLDAGGVRLDELTFDAMGYANRSMAGRAWQWRPGETTLRPLALAPEGPCWSASARQGWTAEAYPHADLVKLVSPQGQTWWLGCYYPVTVAWAGDSLMVVSTTSGSVLRFPHLTRHLHP